MFLLERSVTKSDLSQIEKYADRLFAKVGIDVEFTRHFVDRVNDERNKKQISVAELVRIFNKAYQKYGKIARLGPDAEAVMKDMRTDINMPFVLKLMRNGMLELVAKTIMRREISKRLIKPSQLRRREYLENKDNQQIQRNTLIYIQMRIRKEQYTA